MKAIPLSAGIRRKKLSRASNPPAEEPIATIGKRFLAGATSLPVAGFFRRLVLASIPAPDFLDRFTATVFYFQYRTSINLCILSFWPGSALGDDPGWRREGPKR